MQHPAVTPKKTHEGTNQLETTYLELRRMIVECEVMPGSTVSEPLLTQQLGVGKAAMRAALLKLSHDGFLRAVPRQGYEVAPLSIADALDLVEMRAITEPRAAYFAAGKIAEKSLREAEVLFRGGVDAHDRKQMTRFLQATHRFKRSIADASGNRVLGDSVIEVSQRFDRYLRLCFNWSTVDQTNALQLIQALRVGNAADAAACLRRVIRYVSLEIVSELLANEVASTLSGARNAASYKATAEELLEPRLRIV